MPCVAWLQIVQDMRPASLEPGQLLLGYRRGEFPYPDQSLPGVAREAKAAYFWHSPDPRTVFFTHDPIAATLRRALRRFPITVNGDFLKTVIACAETSRTRQTAEDHASKAWITNELIDAYEELHRRGNAFSIEARTPDGALVGGLFGICVGRFVTVESMYRLATDSSKAAFAALLTTARKERVPLIGSYSA